MTKALADYVVTDKALQSYRELLGRVPLYDAALQLADALEDPLFSCPDRDGATLHGLIDKEERRFLALSLNDAIIQIGPPHYWHSARESWKSVGWNVGKGKPYTAAGGPQ